MLYDSQFHHRRSIRLRGYDYTSAGAYFVTICAQNRECLFGEVSGGEMRLGTLGECIASVWQAIPDHFPGVELDAMVVMPNHMHGIIVLAGAKHLRHFANASPLRGTHGTQPASLAAIIQNFKSVSTRKINVARGTPGTRVWQRNYYEHVVRGEADLRRIHDYIAHNPAKWETDRLYSRK